jgi:hypothetical protein
VTRNQLLLAAAGAALVLLTPLVILVRSMCKPANRARIGAGSWTPVLFLWLVAISAWLWLQFSKVEIKVQISGTRQLLLAVIALTGIYIVWIVSPVAAITVTLLKLGHAKSENH